jgi:hypothetical protein
MKIALWHCLFVVMIVGASVAAQDDAEKNEIARLRPYPKGFHFVDAVRPDARVFWTRKEVVAGRLKTARKELASVEEFKKELLKAKIDKEAYFQVNVTATKVPATGQRVEAILQFLDAEGYKKVGKVAD